MHRMREMGTPQTLVLPGGASARTKSGSEGGGGSEGIPEAGAPGVPRWFHRWNNEDFKTM